MSSRSHRWEAGKTPLSQHHGGSAQAARMAVKAARIEKLQAFTKARAEAPAPKVAPAPRRLRPRARPESASRWNCRTGVRLRQHTGYAPPEPQAYVTKEHADYRRKILMVAQAGLCGLCGKPIHDEDRGSPTKRPSLDHVIPRDLGGGNPFNLLAAHNQCNADKTNDLPTGCEVIWLLAVNARIRALPVAMQAAFYR